MSTIGVIFEHLEFKTSEGDKHVGKVHFLVSYWIAQGPFWAYKYKGLSDFSTWHKMYTSNMNFMLEQIM